MGVGRFQVTRLHSKARGLLLCGEEILGADSHFTVGSDGGVEFFTLLMYIAQIVSGFVSTLVYSGKLGKALNSPLIVFQFHVQQRHGEQGFPILRVQLHQGGELSLRRFILLVLYQQLGIAKSQILVVSKFPNTVAHDPNGLICIASALQYLRLQHHQPGAEVN